MYIHQVSYNRNIHKNTYFIVTRDFFKKKSV